MGASMAAHLQKAGFQPIVHDMHQDTATQEVLRYYQQAEGIAEPIAKANPDNSGWQRNLSVAHGRNADVLRARVLEQVQSPRRAL